LAFANSFDKTTVGCGLNIALSAYRLIIETNPDGKNSLTNCDTVGVGWLVRQIILVLALVGTAFNLVVIVLL
jgi:hypothetical protein